MADVARLAGVSHQTVSRVINKLPNIRPATRAQVEEAIRVLGYHPNRAARALVTRRTATIGVIGTEAGLWGPTTVQRTIEQAARSAGYFVSAVNLESVCRAGLAAAVAHLTAQDVEGMVVIAANDEALDVVRAQETGVPLVVVEGDLTKRGGRPVVDQLDGCPQGHPAPARPRTSRDRTRHRAAHLDRGARPRRGLAQRARGSGPASRRATGR